MKLKQFSGTINFVLFIAVVVLILAQINGCRKNNRNSNDAAALANYKHQVKYYKDKEGKLTAYNYAVETDLKTAKHQIDSLSSYLKNLKVKEPRTIIRVVTDIRIDSVPVLIHDSLPCDAFSRQLAVDNEYYKMRFNLNNERLMVENVSIPNTQEIILGMQKNGFFKRDSLVAIVRNSNPYVQTQMIGALAIRPQPEWYRRWWFKAAIGVAGFVIGTTVK